MLSRISQNNFTNVNVKFQNNIVNDKSHYFDLWLSTLSSQSNACRISFVIRNSFKNTQVESWLACVHVCMANMGEIRYFQSNSLNRSYLCSKKKWIQNVNLCLFRMSVETFWIFLHKIMIMVFVEVWSLEWLLLTAITAYLNQASLAIRTRGRAGKFPVGGETNRSQTATDMVMVIK